MLTEKRSPCKPDITLAHHCKIYTYYARTRLFKYIKTFTTKKENFQIKNTDMFQISAQNIDCEYSLEPPRRGGSNEYPQSIFEQK